jgi:hypothetical protein
VRSTSASVVKRPERERRVSEEARDKRQEARASSNQQEQAAISKRRACVLPMPNRMEVCAMSSDTPSALST